MTKEITKYEQMQDMAKSAASSGFFPGIKTAEQALVLMALADAEGIPPIQAMMRYDVIQGRPAKKSQAMLTDFLKAGGKVKWLQHGADCCEATFSHPDGGEVTVKWDLAKAKQAQLTGKENWSKHPENMLHARCVSNGVRFVYPAATGGLYDPSEVSDFVSERIPQESKTEVTVVSNDESSFPDIPDVVTVIPLALCRGVFKKLSEFDGIPISDLSLTDLEMVISVISENKSKVRNENAKSWLNAIEAEATLRMRDLKLDEMEFSETK